MIKKFKLFKINEDNHKTDLREVRVEYENGDVIETSMAANLTDEEIYDYFRPGKIFNIGTSNDNLQKVKNVEIIK